MRRLKSVMAFDTCLSAGVPQGQFTADEGLDLLGSGRRAEESVTADSPTLAKLQAMGAVLTGSERFYTRACI